MRLILSAMLLASLAACRNDAAPDPLAALVQGETWQITQIAGIPVPSDTEVTLLRVEEGQIAGRSGCNRYSGPLEVRDGKLHIGEIVGTRMMCAPTRMQFEQAFHAVLGRVDTITATTDGIALQAGEETLMTGVRPAE